MSDRLQRIRFRGRIAFAFCLLACVFQFTLTATGLAHYDFVRGLPPDRSFCDRIFLISEWMIFACFFVSSASEFRVRQAVLFNEAAAGIGPVVAGMVGLVVLIMASIQFIRHPYSGESFDSFEGWLYGVGWLFVWWYFVFRR